MNIFRGNMIEYSVVGGLEVIGLKKWSKGVIPIIQLKTTYSD